MLQPVAFQQDFIALSNISYVFGAPGVRANSEGGVLRQGQMVWMESGEVPDYDVTLMAAFVEEVGIISLNPHWLITSSMVRHSDEN